MSRTLARIAVAFAIVIAPVSARAQGPAPSAGTEGDFEMRDFKFTDGSTLPVLRIHYTTLGHPRKDARGVVRNAVLIMHGTTGSGRGFLSRTFGGELFQAGQPLDTASHYIILPDGIGTGKSSRPSEGLHAKFPRYGYEDMVTAQYRLVTEGLGVNHLLLVMGTSMGAMHTWMWGERYPDFMDGLMPLASAPTQIAGRNRMMRALVSKSIREDPDWNNGEYTKPPRGLMTGLTVLWMMTSSPLQQQKQGADARQCLTRSSRATSTTACAPRTRTTFSTSTKASRDYDPSVALEKIKAPLVAINSADDVGKSAGARPHGAPHAAREAREVHPDSNERPHRAATDTLSARQSGSLTSSIC
jgi:homoserine O-acetyltransferase